MGEKNYEQRDRPSKAEQHPAKEKDTAKKLGAGALKGTVKR